ncbi:MAG: hypothetical protein ACRDC6_08945 [Shewanella sp.]
MKNYMKLSASLRLPNLGYTSTRPFLTLLCSCAIGTSVVAGEGHFSIIDYMEEDQLLSVNVVTTSIGERRLYIQSDGVLSEITRFSRIGDHTLFIYLPCDDFQQGDSLHYKVGSETLQLSLNGISCKASKKAHVKNPKLIHLDKQCVIDPKGTTLWRIGSLLNEKNGYSVYQNIYAVFLMNRQSFIDDDISRLQDNLLICPSEELIASIDKIHAAEMFQDAESFRVAGLSDPASISEDIAVDSDTTSLDGVMIAQSGATDGSKGGRVESILDEPSITLVESLDKQENSIVATTSTESIIQELAQFGDMEPLASQHSLDEATMPQVDESIVASIDTATIVGTAHAEFVSKELAFSQTENSEKVMVDIPAEGMAKASMPRNNDPDEVVTDEPDFFLAENSDKRDEMEIVAAPTGGRDKELLSRDGVSGEAELLISPRSHDEPEEVHQVDHTMRSRLEKVASAGVEDDGPNADVTEILMAAQSSQQGETEVMAQKTVSLKDMPDEALLLESHLSPRDVDDVKLVGDVERAKQGMTGSDASGDDETVIMLIANEKTESLSAVQNGVLPNCSIDPKQKTLWRVSVTLGQLNGFSVYQNMYALYSINQEVFPTRDINKMLNIGLKCPTANEVEKTSNQKAKQYLYSNFILP